MSIDALCWAFKQKLPCQEKFVLVALADMADMDRKCWPSQALLAERCGIARETVNRLIRALGKAGMIRVEQRTNGHGKQSSLYFVLCDEGSHPNVIRDHTHVTSDHIEPSLEPSEEKEEAANAASKKAAHHHVGGSNGSGSKGSRLAADWQPAASDIEFAEGCGLDARRVADEFRDYWHACPGSKGLKLDWPATWRNWCRRAEPSDSSGGRRQSWRPPEKPGPVAAAMHSVLSRMRVD